MNNYFFSQLGLILFIFASLTYNKAVEVLDLTHDVNNETIYWPNGIPFQFYIQHRGPINPDLEENEDNFWYEANAFQTAEHCGTHLDAPVHFARHQWSVDQIPASRFFGSVSIIDLREKIKDNQDYLITTEDLLQWEIDFNRKLEPLIILWTGWAERWPNKEKYLGTSSNDIQLLRFPGLHPDAAQWLVNNRIIHGVAIDTASIDYGQSNTFLAHRIMTRNNIFFIENLNTKSLNSIDLDRHVLLSVSPLKITTGSGSPVRPILILSGTFNNEIRSPENSAKSDL